MELIETKKQWVSYKKMYEAKAEGFEPKHNITNPDNFPFLVATHFNLDGGKIYIYHICAFKEDCLELLKCCNKNNTKKTTFRHHVDE
jgi:hypothetical protein